MAVRKILLEEDSALRRRARPITSIDRRILTLLGDMADTMYKAEGVGLAAPQVGIMRRIVVIDVGDGLLELINPEIVESTGEQVNPEGCLSIPGRRCTVARPEFVTVRAVNRDGDEIEVSGDGYLAVALCHEIDHLDGILYIDKMIEDVTDQPEEETDD